MMRNLLVILVLIGALVAPSASSPSLDLSGLCRNEPVDLARVSQVVKLIETVETTRQNDCDDSIVAALNDLRPILDGILVDACNKQRVEQIHKFQETHLADGTKKLPQSLTDFYWGLGLNVASACKSRMLAGLTDTLPKMPELMGQQYENFFGSQQDIRIGSIGYNDVVVFGHIKRETLRSMKGKLPSVQLKGATKLRNLNNLCQKIAPIYSNLLDPVVTLSSVGLNFKDHKDLKRESNRDELRNWFKLIYVCENLLSVHFYEVDEAEIERLGLDDATMRLLNEADVQKLEAAGHKSQTGNAFIASNPSDQQSVMLTDLVVDSDDKVLIKTIEKLADRKKRFAFIRGLGSSFKESFRSNKLSLLSSILGTKKFKIMQRDEKSGEQKTLTVDEYLNSNDQDAGATNSAARRKRSLNLFGGTHDSYSVATCVKGFFLVLFWLSIGWLALLLIGAWSLIEWVHKKIG